MQKKLTRKFPLKLRIQFWQLRYFFLQELVKKIAQCPKMKKKLEIKLFFVKMLFWTRRMQLQRLRRKTRKEAEKFLLNVWNDEKFQLFSKTVFFSKWFHRYEECSFDRPAKIVLLNYRKWLKKKSTRNAKTFQN